MGRPEWCHPGGWLSLNARWVVSRSPAPFSCHGNAVFVSVVTGRSQQGYVLSHSFSLAPPLLRHSNFWIQIFIFLNHSLFLYKTLISHPPAPSFVCSHNHFNNFSHPSLYISISPFCLSRLSLSSVELLTFYAHFLETTPSALNRLPILLSNFFPLQCLSLLSICLSFSPCHSLKKEKL